MLLMRALSGAMKMVIKLYSALWCMKMVVKQYSALWCIGENGGKVG